MSDSESGRMITTLSLQSAPITSEPLTTEAISFPPGPSISTMSQVPSTATSSTNFEEKFTAALKMYYKQTKCDILSHPLAAQLQSCNSLDAIIAVLRTQVQPLTGIFDQSKSANEVDEGWGELLAPTVHVLGAFSASLDMGIELRFLPLIAICAGIGVLLEAAMNVRSGQDDATYVFRRMEPYFQRLWAYKQVRPTADITDIFTEILVEVLLILGIATNEVGQG
ncbi:hypothetical protein EI94DRAFT_1324104 [Lactarius quietus]|nr:hypothetical protein EI94DRAFT_1324104 [Lactarius quietus]